MDTAVKTTIEEGTGSAPLRLLFGADRSPLNQKVHGSKEARHTNTRELSKYAPTSVLYKAEDRVTGSFQLLQSWAGNVISIESDSFVAVVHDRTNPNNPDGEVTLDIKEVTSDDLPLLAEGAVFYWSIGYADFPGRPRLRISEIRFRRLPSWSQKEIDSSKEKAKRLAKRFATD